MSINVSCIICAFNEEKRVSKVLDAAKQCTLIDEIVFIDDGSTDRTSQIAESSEIKVIKLKQNRGKSFALATGIAAAQGDILLLLDADLVNLSPSDLDALITPVLTQQADSAISLRKTLMPHSLLAYYVLGVDFISGERVIEKKLVSPHIESMAQLPGFGVEVFLNDLLISAERRVAIIKWNNVINPRKSEKRGLLKGVIAEIQMMRDVLKVISLGKAIRQHYALLTHQPEGRGLIDIWALFKKMSRAAKIQNRMIK